MAVFFLDTSALVKRNVNEAGNSWVRALTHPRSPHQLYIARITAVEVTSAITRRQRGGSLTPAQGGAILGHFRRYLGERYLVVEFTVDLAEEAMRLARSTGLRAYDAVQLATALELHREFQKNGIAITLISADRELNAAATAEGLTVDDPNSHP